MRRKIICTRPAPPESEFIAGGEASPCLSAGESENAQPPGRADAKQPGETASRLLRIVPAGAETTIRGTVLRFWNRCFRRRICPRRFHSIFSIWIFIYCRSRGPAPAGTSTGVARNAHAIGRIAGNLGAVPVRAAAHLLEDACLMGDHAATYGLISALSRACDEARMELDDRLAPNPRRAPVIAAHAVSDPSRPADRGFAGADRARLRAGDRAGGDQGRNRRALGKAQGNCLGASGKPARPEAWPHRLLHPAG